MQKLLLIEDFSHISSICGPQDTNIKFLEQSLNVAISLQPQGFLVEGLKEKVAQAITVIGKIAVLAKEGLAFDQQELSRFVTAPPAVKENVHFLKNSKAPLDQESGIRVPSARKKFVFS